jgi:hypothetical protein
MVSRVAHSMRLVLAVGTLVAFLESDDWFVPYDISGSLPLSLFLSWFGEQKRLETVSTDLAWWGRFNASWMNEIALLVVEIAIACCAWHFWICLSLFCLSLSCIHYPAQPSVWVPQARTAFTFVVYFGFDLISICHVNVNSSAFYYDLSLFLYGF